jgi:hypothetical protein
MTIYLPSVDFTKPTLAPPGPTPGPAPAAVINSVATPASEAQLTIAAQNAPLRICYGPNRLGAQIANMLAYNGAWVVQAIWCEGEIAAIDAVHFNDETVPAGVTVTHYLGTTGQTVDATLVAAFAAAGITYTDALPGIAYSVFTIPAGTDTGMPQIAATLRGRILPDTLVPKAFSDIIAFTRADASTCASYFDSTGTLQLAAANVPRIDYDPVTLECKGLLIEETRANVVRNATASCSGTSTTASTGTVTGPDGALATKVVPNSGAVSYPGSGTYSSQTYSNATSAGQTTDYSFSGYFSTFGPNNYKPYIVITADSNPGNELYALLLFNCSTGAVTSKSLSTGWTEVIAPQITLAPCGMWLVKWTVRFTQQATLRTRIGHYLQIYNEANTAIYTADGASGIQRACNQFEIGSFPTSYIPTVAAAVTRSADAASITEANFSSWYNQTEGSAIVRFWLQNAGVSNISFSNNSYNERVELRIGTTTASGLIVVDGGSTSVNDGVSGLAANTEYTFAAALKVNDFAWSRNGSTAGTDTTGTMPTPDRLRFGDATGAAGAVSYHIANLTYYPTRLPNADLAILSSGATIPDQPSLVLDFANQRYYLAADGYSDNPALCLADFLASSTHGLGRDIHWASVIDAANACDELVNSSKRRTIGLTLDSPQPVRSWIDTLRTYAGCWVVAEGSEAMLIPSRPRATDASLLHASGQIRAISALKKRGVAQAPTSIEVRYTDTSALPWRDASVYAEASGIDVSVARRSSQVALPGIQSASQAYREAVERLNHQWLADLSFDLDVFDEGLQLQLGDVVEVTHPIGLAAKKMRVLGITGDYGRYKLRLTEYDDALYSDAIASDPSYPDTNLPNPATPPDLAGLTASEEVYQLENGNYASRIALTWTAPIWPYLHDYIVTLTQAGNVIDTRRQNDNSYRSPAITEGLEYVCTVAVVSSIGAVGDVAQVNVTAQGKQLIPGDVPSVTAFEAGGRVYASWAPATDIDIWRYEVRYGTGGWAAATRIDRVDALTLITDLIPVGTWTLYIKAIDSIDQESTNAATASVTVTSDAAAFLVDSYDQTAPTLTNMASFTLDRTDTNTYYVTEDAVAFGTKYSSNLSTYSNALATYHSSLTSTWLGESEDFGLSLSGQWTGTASVSALSGSLTSYLGISPDGSAWTYYNGLSQKLTGRFSRLKHEALTTSTLLATIPTQNIRLDAIPRTEQFTGTSSAAGPTTITMENDYVSVKKITLTPEGTTARSATYDNIVLGNPTTIDVYVFNDAGTKIASTFRGEFQGV